jgi:hypothetical protein
MPACAPLKARPFAAPAGRVRPVRARMPHREPPIHHLPLPRSGRPARPAADVADVVSARARERAIAQRLRHGLLRLPLAPGGAPRW